MNSFERRVKSYSIDTSLAFIIVVLIAFGVPIKSGATEAEIAQFVQIKMIVCAVCYYGVYLIPNLICKGQTFGRRVEKMKVVDIKTNETPKLWLVLLREFVKCTLVLVTAGMYILIGGLIFNSREDGRTIHDFIFHTKVICLTRYTSDKEEMLRFQTDSAKKSLKGTGYND